jgi:GT2 family glycosyltransferase
VSIVIPAHNQWPYTNRCLTALEASSRDVAHEVIVVDNGSTDATARALAQQPGVRSHVNPTNLGFARACNQGAALARAPYLLFLNNDTEPRAGWLAALVQAADADPAVAIAGGKLLFADDTIQSAGLLLAYGFPYPLSIVPRDYRKPAALAPAGGDVRAVTGACMLVRRAAFAAAGGFDEGFVNGYEDVDLCLRAAEQGGRIVYCADSVVTHHEAVSGGRFKNEAANLDRLQRKWMDRLDRARFDYDYRRCAAHAPARADRPGASVVVVAQDALATIVPCLENVRYTLAPQDELIVVDDGSRGASAQVLASFAREHAGVTRLLSVPGGGDGGGGAGGVAPLGFARAAALGIGAARKDYVALLPPNLKVAAGWLDKLIAHLGRDPALALVSPSTSGRRAADEAPLYAPPQAYAAPGASVLDKLVTAGPRAARVPPSGCLVGRRQLMGELAAAPGFAAAGAPPTALADHLKASGRTLGAVGDVFVRRLNQVGGDHHGPDRARYLERQGAAPGSDLVSVVILLRDNLRLTRECIESVFRHTPLPVEVVIVDNGSSEDVAGYAAELRAAGRAVVYLRNERNEGFAFGCNQGIAASRGVYLVLLNNDVVVTDGWLTRQLALLGMDPAIAVVGPTTNATSGAQLVGTAIYRGIAEVDRFAAQWALEHAGEFAIVPRIVGLCMVMRRALIDQIGGFDTAFGYGNCEDDDLCVRLMRAGHKIAIAYDVFIHHHGSATFRSLDLDARALVDENWAIFCQKWNHPERWHGLDALAALGSAAPFDPARDRVPVAYREIFHPGAPPLRFDTKQPIRVLCIPDLRDRGGPPDGTPSWRPALERFLRTFSAADPVALVVRVEPPTQAGADRAARALGELLRELGIEPSAAPEIVIDVTALPAARRGSLYTGASVYLACGGPREPFHRREAEASGATVADLDLGEPAPKSVAPPAAPARGPRWAPKVSVIVPTHDRPRLLEQALRSVLAQSEPDFEIIVVNDAGAPVADVIERLNGGGQIRYLENAANRGHGASRNVGLRAARGRYVAYLDDDDTFLPDHLATLLGALSDGDGVPIAYADARRAHVQADGVTVTKRDVPYSTDFDPDAILLSNFIPILCVMHERACAASFDESLPVLEDWDLWIRLSRRFRFRHVPRVTCEFTVRADGSSVTSERLRLFASAERALRQRYLSEIAKAPRALQALCQSLIGG